MIKNILIYGRRAIAVVMLSAYVIPVSYGFAQIPALKFAETPVYIMPAIKTEKKLPEIITVEEPIEEPKTEVVEPVEPQPTPAVEPAPVIQEPVVTEAPVQEPIVTTGISDADIQLLCLITMAEAGGESELGIRLVIDTILNRMDSPQFPNSVSGVVYQKNQFDPVRNGAINRCYVRDDIYRLVLEEVQNRTNSEVAFFRTQRYSSYGTPLFVVGNHYFSKY